VRFLGQHATKRLTEGTHGIYRVFIFFYPRLNAIVSIRRCRACSSNSHQSLDQQHDVFFVDSLFQAIELLITMFQVISKWKNLFANFPYLISTRSWQTALQWNSEDRFPEACWVSFFQLSLKRLVFSSIQACFLISVKISIFEKT